MPISHETEAKLPAVSGSSGRLGVERSPSEPTEPAYPGRVFAEPDRAYAEAMAEVAATSWAAPAKAEVDPPDSLKAQKQAFGQEQQPLRDSRRHLRRQRQQENAVQYQQLACGQIELMREWEQSKFGSTSRKNAPGPPSGGLWRQCDGKACGPWVLESHGTLFFGRRQAGLMLWLGVAAVVEGMGIRAAGRVVGLEPSN